MKRALLLASKGEGRVSPNPLVGAVLAKGGRVIGEGWHGFFGGPHAEVNAIGDAEGKGRSARGATLYVSLEPCSHSGGLKKTPPCVPLIIKKGIARVVVAAKDANPQVKGIEQLRSAGIKVKTGVLRKEAEEQNEAFFKHMSTGKPFVALKIAQSSNGKIGCRGKGRVRISGKEFDSHVQKLRNRYDAILVGINTVLADNPRLTCRLKGARNPVRIIMDSRLRIPLNARVLENAHRFQAASASQAAQPPVPYGSVIIATAQAAGMGRERALRERGAHVLVCGKKKASLKALLESLPSLGIYSVLIEGGAQIAKSALRGKLVDRLIVAVSKKKIPERGAVPSPIPLAILRKLKAAKMGDDTIYSGILGKKLKGQAARLAR